MLRPSVFNVEDKIPSIQETGFTTVNYANIKLEEALVVIHKLENVTYLQFQQRQHWVSQAAHHGFHILQHVCLEVWLRDGEPIENVFQVVASTLVYLMELLTINTLCIGRLWQTTREWGSL